VSTQPRVELQASRSARWCSSSRARWAIVLFVCLLVGGGCVSVSVRTTGADTVADFQGEDQYKVVYAQQMSKFQGDLRLLEPAGSNPGVCNAGGSQQGCYDVDATLIVDLRSTLDALSATSVPPRFVAADKLLAEALSQNIRALELRNQAIAKKDNAAWTQHKSVLADALALYQKSYEAFPEDNRPVPRP
jgi:hypothetical protein